jgi:hypothetical protein
MYHSYIINLDRSAVLGVFPGTVFGQTKSKIEPLLTGLGGNKRPRDVKVNFIPVR